MALSKLKANSLDRTTLYYNKFEYRVVIKSPHMFYSWNCKTIDDYKSRIDEVTKDYINDPIQIRGWRRPIPEVEDWEYTLVENVLSLKQKYKIGKELTFRHENQTMSIYTSDTKIVNEILKFHPESKITQVNLMPTGVMTFKREPPSKYRAYFTNNKMPLEFKDDFMAYVSRTPDVRPSDALYNYLTRTNWKYPPYLWDKYYVDYDDDKNLMMMMLMFPGAIGKKYKLEKK